MRIDLIKKNKRVIGRDLDELIKKVNALSHIRGSGGIKIVTGPLGTSIIGSKTTEIKVRRAITTQAAPAATYITANLYGFDGVEITSGAEAGINVHCSIIGDVNLNAAVPRLANGDDIFVVSQLPYASATTVISSWYCVSLFQKSQDCD